MTTQDDPFVELSTFSGLVGTGIDTMDLGPQDRTAVVIELVGGEPGRTHVIAERVLLGRGAECDVRVTHRGVSRRHAQIDRRSDGVCVLRDLGSRNGTLVNEVPIYTERPLAFGDRVSLGSEALLLFSHQDELYDRLLHQQRMESLGQLAGGIAHDFNNLLGAVLANADFVLGQPEAATLDADTRDALQEIKQAAKRATGVAAQLLGTAREGSFERQPVDLSGVADEVVRLCGRTFDRAVSIESRIEPFATVEGDGGMLHQVLMNLMLNARDAMPDGGTVTLTVHAEAVRPDDEAGRAIVTVEDTGIGMDAETCRRAFDPYFSTKAKGRGTGLGLATVYGIVSRHCGSVRVDSESGRGTRFVVELPLSTSEPADEEASATNARRLDPAADQILVVDDDALFRGGLRRLLSLSGYRALVADGGIEAVEMFRAEKARVALVILDVQMPQMDGLETLRALRAIDPGIPIVVVSGHSDQDRAAQLLAEPMTVFLRKPFGQLQLEDAIHGLVSVGDPADARRTLPA